MVQTPVGARCPECARLYKLPTYSVSTVHYLLAGGTALVLAVLVGVVWEMLSRRVPYFDLNLLLGPVAGYVIGEATSRAVNRKRGIGLAAIGAAGVAIGFAVNLLPRLVGDAVLHLSLQFILFSLLSLAIGIYLAVSRLR
jgi:hypothetical protein